MFEIRREGFFLDGKKFRLFSGAMHYFRVLPEYWDDRFAKMKAAGFNAVETVMCWNLHEPKEGEFDFSGMLDVVRYCLTAQKHGLYVILRTGPYTCGEWDFGGFPAWMLADKNLRLRCNNEKFLSKVANYYRKVIELVSPLQSSHGGNILAMQIENEYGSYGNDKDYLMAIEKIMIASGVDVPLFTSDGNAPSMLSGGTLPHVYKTLNFGSRADTVFQSLQKIQPDMPKTCMEFWCGWFDHWGEIHHRRNHLNVGKEIQKLVDSQSNVNIYMFHGGTNFNFWAGANHGGRYQPTVTSYDDAALLNEYGEYTPAYHKVREIFLTTQGLPTNMPLPPSPKVQNIGEVRLTNRGSLWNNLYKLGEKHISATPESMECFGQNFGYVLYRKVIKGHYEPSTIYVEGVHDIAYLRINGETVKKYYRTKNAAKKKNDGFRYKLDGFEGEMTVEILVEGMGRVNYGPEMEGDRKGIQKVRLGLQTIFGWDIYTLPFDNLEKVTYDNAALMGGPMILKGSFHAEKNKDCFVDTKGFSKGFITVNGFNLGRYWARGPQRTLYLPAPLLREENEIIIVEQEGCRRPAISIIDKHLL